MYLTLCYAVNFNIVNELLCRETGVEPVYNNPYLRNDH
jgi:hypothetical protein